MATRVKVPPWLLLQLVARRVEWIPLVAVIVCLVGASLQWLALPQIEQRTRAVAKLLVDNPSGDSHLDGDFLNTERYRTFQDRLADSADRGELLKIVFSEATAAGIPLTQGDYSLVAEIEGGYDKFQIILPVKGTYKQIRSFAKALLEKLPPLAMDEISFRRDTIKSPTVEARLRLTLYLKNTR